MSEYTKGPWRLYPATYLTQLSRTIQSGDGRRNLARVHISQSSESEGLGNARLMAAAPELREALKSLTLDAEEVARNSYSISGSNFDEDFRAEDPYQYKRVQIAKAAISKATETNQ